MKISHDDFIGENAGVKNKFGQYTIAFCNFTDCGVESYSLHEASSIANSTFIDNTSGNTTGVFDKSIQALKMLNDVGYGVENSGLTLDLVYNPSGAFLPPNQLELQLEFKKKLSENGADVSIISKMEIAAKAGDIKTIIDLKNKMNNADFDKVTEVNWSESMLDFYEYESIFNE